MAAQGGIGGWIGRAIMLAIFLAPVGFTAWLVYDRVDVMLSAELQPAQITRCQVHRNDHGNSSKASFAPVAKTADGSEVEGGFTPSRKSWCEYFIGDDVSVFIHPADESKNRIHSFLQFYLAPLGGLLLSILLLGAFIRKKK
ncbi:hypothetical protein GCM10009096_19770 [Parasphingorhabdus litoris]|uniref:DUF3592 domain-containing protein n=1 Tax=Parasphingorhabdus litoris TaxID=394733 RepID=A0ABN1AJA3_9SPHN|nr:DUF3592 domain-containing protein [Parasphingorhabdus litoris]